MKWNVLSCFCVFVCVINAFRDAFVPSESHPFNPRESRSFGHAFGNFHLSYADSTSLRGFVGHDYVQVGKYSVKTKFGCVTYCNSPDFNGVDGIMGFGLRADPTLPRPLFLSLSDQALAYDAANHLVPNRKFSFMSTEKSAELQLGGHDPASVSAPFFYVPAVPGRHDYAVKVPSMKYGPYELLDFQSDSDYYGEPTVNHVLGIIDSGTSCLVIPDGTLGGKLVDSPYRVFQEHRDLDATFVLEVNGHRLEIPYSVWYLSLSNQVCVQKLPSMVHAILIGDVLFRKYVVQFDLSDPDAPVLGFAPQATGYTPSASTVGGVDKYPMTKVGPQGTLPLVGGMRQSPTQKRANALSLVPVRNKDDTQYFVHVGIGKPVQNLTVIFDTGSSVFGVFSKAPNDYYHRAVFDEVDAGSSLSRSRVGDLEAIAALSVVALLLAFAAAVVYRRRRRRARSGVVPAGGGGDDGGGVGSAGGYGGV